MLTVTKRFEFEAAHRLPEYDGKCSRVHGHRFQLEIEVSGRVIDEGPKRGMILDFGDLKRIVQERVVEKLDHQYLNDLSDLSFVPTAENLVMWIVGELRYVLLGLFRVRLWETSTSYCEWKK
jgi:6-pyruvoyltetrahydropterin/6-carboxytetrahydropterin synthase